MWVKMRTFWLRKPWRKIWTIFYNIWYQFFKDTKEKEKPLIKHTKLESYLGSEKKRTMSCNMCMKVYHRFNFYIIVHRKIGNWVPFENLSKTKNLFKIFFLRDCLEFSTFLPSLQNVDSVLPPPSQVYNSTY